jgi:hypothetical protein
MRIREKMLARHRALLSCVLASSFAVCFVSSAIGAPLADTQADYSTTAQGTNGFLYGDYHNDATNTYHNDGLGVFDTSGWTVDGSGNWDGNEGLFTPAVGPVIQHPAFNTLRPAVRRYTVGSNGEPSFTGFVEIKGSFSDLDPGGKTDGFVTVDGVNRFYHLVDSTTANSPVLFDIFAPVTNGSTIDFGADASTDGGFNDSTGLTATIATAPEPALGGAGLACLLLLRRRTSAN